jgi:mutator protein MutT
MPISDYLRELRLVVGRRLLLVPGVAAVIHDEGGQVLVERRSDDGTWGLPAGAVDPGETPAAAVVREVREETGLVVVPERVLGVFGGTRMRTRYPNGDEAEYTVVVFACRAVGGRLAAVDGEALELVFVPAALAASRIAKYPAALFAAAPGASPLFDL